MPQLACSRGCLRREALVWAALHSQSRGAPWSFEISLVASVPLADRLNDKTDGWYDGLLPDYTIVTAMRSVGCVEGRARSAWLELEESLPSFAAVIGPTCSKDVADVAGQEWRGLTSGSRAVVISPGSTTPELKNEAAYPNVARAAGTDEQMAQAFTKLGETFGWDRVAILHDDSMWGAGAAWAFKTAFKGEVIKTVGFDLSAFDAGAGSAACCYSSILPLLP